MEKNDKSGSDANRRVSDILDVFMALRKGDAKDGELFLQIEKRYRDINEQEKEALFTTIIEKIEVPKEELDPLLSALLNCDSDDPELSILLAELRSRVDSPRLNIFRKISRLSGGLKFLLNFRGDLLSIQRFSKTNLRPLDADLVILFESWFQEGFLYLEEITQESSYRQIELIKNSDLVHPMTGIEEMGQRLGKDRRCFALYHRLIPYEPIIFIEVALTRGIVRSISEIIGGDEDRPEEGDADTAIFYSINNPQHGLAGLGMGKMLIGQVVDYLRKDQEQIKVFATLSPLPGFWKRYLRPILEGRDEPFLLKKKDVRSFFSKKQISKISEPSGLEKGEPEQFDQALLSILSHENWPEDPELSESLRQPLVKIAYAYISKEKNRQNKPLNPVANFHLGNGATVSQKDVNFLGNPSNRGLQESCGVMVNYIYSASWLGQMRRSVRLFNSMEIKGIFSRAR